MSEKWLWAFEFLCERFAIDNKHCVGQGAQVLDESLTVGSVGSRVEVAASE
jgi:hypothetical protein